ncbi:MAG: GH116 family glycosyl hydrolase [Sedimentisphaerales bacterium]
MYHKQQQSGKANNLTRREFMRDSAIATAGLAIYNVAKQAQAKHFIPVDKKLSRRLVRCLFERGQRELFSGKQLQTIGMPVGGIAAGQLYLRGDGTLGLWQIFNKHVFSGYGRDCYRTYVPDSPVDSGFAVIVKQDGKTTAKPLERNFGRVEFAGEYPIGFVRYRAQDFPVKVEMEAFSPFIPLNAKDSAIPATLFHITVENTSSKKLRAGILGWLENAVLIHSAQAVHALRRSRITNEKSRTLIIHTAEKAPLPEATQIPRPKIVLADFEGPDYGQWKTSGEAFGTGPAKGTLPKQQRVTGFLGKGLVNTYLGGDGPHGTLTSPRFNVSRKFINFLIGGGNHAGRTCINLLIDGKVVRTATGKNNEKLDWYFWNVQEFEGETAQIQILDKHSGGWGHINIDQIELGDEPRKGPVGPLDKLPDYGSMVLALAERGSSPQDVRKILGSVRDWADKLHATDDVIYPVAESRSASLATRTVELAPGTKRLFTFVLAWFFPNHPNGHEYANRFHSAAEVAHYVLDNHHQLAGDTAKWHKTFYEDSTLPRWLLFRLHSTVCNLATGTCQWWKNGRFWAWEGVGCCTGTCTHVWNYAHAPARLFPELERSAREMQDFGEGFDEKTGLVGFRSNRRYAADGQCGTVLKAYREHQMSANNDFLKRNWPRIKKALLFSIARDGNDDGLIEDSQHNTYDINFQGPNTFVGSLYLAALRAGEQMAKEMGDEQFAKRCRKIFESGSRLTVERLWNGEYFIQLVDLKKYPKHQYGKGCLSDQLFGQGWAHQLGLGYIYPPEYVKKALQSVWQYNWAPDVGPYNAVHKPERWFARPGEAGLFTCTWPKSPYLAEGVRYRNEVWTGIEYQVAGHMVAEGMITEALAICRGIHERYHPAKHNPFNEVECGDHYARAMASWGVYTALAGYEYHGPKGHIGFAPRLTPENFQAAFTAAEGWGLFCQKRDSRVQREQIELRWGRLSLKSLAFAVPEDFQPVKVAITADGKPIESDYKLTGGRLDITLRKKLSLTKNQILEVIIQRQDES